MVGEPVDFVHDNEELLTEMFLICGDKSFESGGGATIRGIPFLDSVALLGGE